MFKRFWLFISTKINSFFSLYFKVIVQDIWSLGEEIVSFFGEIFYVVFERKLDTINGYIEFWKKFDYKTFSWKKYKYAYKRRTDFYKKVFKFFVRSWWLTHFFFLTNIFHILDSFFDKYFHKFHFYIDTSLIQALIIFVVPCLVGPFILYYADEADRYFKNSICTAQWEYFDNYLDDYLYITCITPLILLIYGFYFGGFLWYFDRNSFDVYCLNTHNKYWIIKWIFDFLTLLKSIF